MQKDLKRKKLKKIKTKPKGEKPKAEDDKKPLHPQMTNLYEKIKKISQRMAKTNGRPEICDTEMVKMIKKFERLSARVESLEERLNLFLSKNVPYKKYHREVQVEPEKKFLKAKTFKSTVDKSQTNAEIHLRTWERKKEEKLKQSKFVSPPSRGTFLPPQTEWNSDIVESNQTTMIPPAVPKSSIAHQKFDDKDISLPSPKREPKALRRCRRRYPHKCNFIERQTVMNPMVMYLICAFLVGMGRAMRITVTFYICPVIDDWRDYLRRKLPPVVLLHIGI